MSLYSRLKDADLPVISADDTGAVTMAAMSDEQQNLYNQIIYEYFNPVQAQEQQAAQAQSEALKDSYSEIMARLDYMADTDPNDTVQVAADLKALAIITQNCIKVLIRFL